MTDRAEILAQQELSDPPTWSEVRTFLNDSELDFTPTDLAAWLRREDALLKEQHPSRGCIGCEVCSRRWVIQHGAEYIEAMAAILDALAPPPCGFHSYSFEGPCMICGEPAPPAI